MTREQKLKLIWTGMHRDFKGTFEGVKRILVMVPGQGTTAVPLDSLTDAQIDEQMPHAILQRHRRSLARLNRKPGMR